MPPVRKNDDRALNLVAAIVTRAIYFVAGFVATLYLVWRFWLGVSDLAPYQLLLLAAVGGGLTSALGPFIYTANANRGRGKLEEIRRKSKTQD